MMLTKLPAGSLTHASAVETLNQEVNARIKRECPGVSWLANYAASGSADYLDVFEVPDPDTATKVALLIRSVGRANAELWPATPWDRFLELAKQIGK